MAPTGTEEATIVNGTGTELQNDQTIKGRVKRKMITGRMTLSLINVVRKRRISTIAGLLEQCLQMPVK